MNKRCQWEWHYVLYYRYRKSYGEEMLKNVIFGVKIINNQAWIRDKGDLSSD